MIARVVTRRDDTRLAIAATAASALGLAAVVLDDLLGARVFGPPGLAVYGFVALLIGLAGVGPWLARWRRGNSVNVSCGPGVVRAGDLTIDAGDVSALQIAAGARGRSIAIARGSNVVFLEVERADEAAKISEALTVPVVPFGDLGVRPARYLFAPLQAVVTVVAIAFGPLYFAAAVDAFDPGVAIAGKALFGIGGVAASWLALGLLVTRRLCGHAIAIGRAAWDEHAALHDHHTAEAEVDSVSSDAEKRAKALQREEERARAEPIRVANLGRGDEQVGAWLARLDAIPDETHAYRGDAMKKDVLWETLGDDGAPVDARMAAARVLRRRYGEEEAALVQFVEDRDVRVRIEAALEDQEEAEVHIQALGPLFRAR